MKKPFIGIIRGIVFGALCLLGIFNPCPTDGAGVTVITHGLNGNADGWVAAMANQIPADHRFPGTNYTYYKLYFVSDGSGGYNLTWSRLGGSPPFETDSGEIIIAFDWSQLSDGNSYNTYQIASVLASALLSTNFIPELNGHALCELPIHLIGHSRGGSVMCQTCLLLGTNGVWVDQLTTLDPHPLNNDGFYLDGFLYSAVDAPCKTYQNVLFHDNDWEDIGFLVYGEPVAGAYVRQLTSLDGGYQNTSTLAPYHSNVHLWYYGTIDTNTPVSDTEASITATERSSWWTGYEAQGAIAGFYYSLIGGGDRTSMDHPLGLPSDPAIRDGYNQLWDLGGGTNANRTLLPSNNGTWPNIIKFNVTSPNVVAENSFVSTTLYYQYAGTSNLTLAIYFDEDSNPYNSNSIPVLQLQPPPTGAENVGIYHNNLYLNTTNIPPGIYNVYGEISDGVHTRYRYTPESVEILPSQEPPVLGISKLDDAQFLITVNGVSHQKIALQTSADLQNWLPLATNTLASDTWRYTNNAPPNFPQQFYRAILNP